jgi:Effector-associated domain 2
MFEAAVVAWLVALIGDRGVKGITRVIFGTPQERALRRAMELAAHPLMEDVPAESRAGLAEALTKRFTEAPALVPDGRTPVRAALVAAVRAQLAPLADPLTPAGQSYLEAQGINSTGFIDQFTAALLVSIHQVAVNDSSLSQLAAELHAGESHEAEADITAKVDLILDAVEKLRRGPEPDATSGARGTAARGRNNPALQRLPSWAVERIVEGLLKLPSVVNDNARNTIQDMLQAGMGGIPSHNIPRVQVITWLQVCPNYDGGYERLFSTVRLVEGDSLAMRELDKTIIEIGKKLGIGFQSDPPRNQP